MSTHEIVVLGGNFGGLNLVHHLKRQVLPLLSKASTNFHITLVSPNSHFFFKIAAPRALTKEDAIPNEKIFRSLTDSLKQYGDAATFLRGKAVGLDPSTRTVTVNVAGGEQQNLKYDSLFIVTGSTSASPLWTLQDDHEATISAFKSLQEALPKAKSVLIAGGGPVGVETAGEIASAFPELKVTLVSGSALLSGKLKASIAAKAKPLLQELQVEVIENVRVNGATSTGTQTTVELGDGQTKTVDLYIDATGATKANSDFLPKSWLAEDGRVLTRDAYMRVKGDGSDDVSQIYVVGDIVAASTQTAIELDSMVLTAASSFAVDAASKLGVPSGSFLSMIPIIGSKGISQKAHKPMNAMVVPVGPKGGIGQAMGFSLPSFAVKKGKSENFLVELIEPAVTGNKYGKV